ncbi:MAG TPA: hypothetical protein V6D09_21235, partial [Leptolyngbyaceae cyanobacterium]
GASTAVGNLLTCLARSRNWYGELKPFAIAYLLTSLLYFPLSPHFSILLYHILSQFFLRYPWVYDPDPFGYTIQPLPPIPNAQTSYKLSYN